MKKPGGDFAIAYLRSEMKPFMLIERNIEQGKISPFSKKTAADFQGDFRFQSRILITQSQFFDKTQRPAFGDCADVNGMIRFFDLITVLSRLFIPAGIAFYDPAAGGFQDGILIGIPERLAMIFDPGDFAVRVRIQEIFRTSAPEDQSLPVAYRFRFLCGKHKCSR